MVLGGVLKSGVLHFLVKVQKTAMVLGGWFVDGFLAAWPA